MPSLQPTPSGYAKGTHPNSAKHHFKKGNPGSKKGRGLSLEWRMSELLMGTRLRGTQMPDGKTVQEVIAENLILGAADVNSKHHQFCMHEVLKRYAPVIVQGSLQLQVDEGEKAPIRKWTESELTKVVEIYTEARYASAGSPAATDSGE